jgi:hypothetical protein
LALTAPINLGSTLFFIERNVYVLALMAPTKIQKPYLS